MSGAPAVTPLTEVVRAVSMEVPIFLALGATLTGGGPGRRVGRGGVASRVWVISRAFAPCSIAVDVCIKLLEIVNDASSCEVSMDEVGDENLSESLMTSRMPWRMAAAMEVVMMVWRLRVASLPHPRLSSSIFSVSMASRMM